MLFCQKCGKDDYGCTCNPSKIVDDKPGEQAKRVEQLEAMVKELEAFVQSIFDNAGCGCYHHHNSSYICAYCRAEKLLKDIKP